VGALVSLRRSARRGGPPSGLVPRPPSPSPALHLARNTTQDADDSQFYCDENVHQPAARAQPAAARPPAAPAAPLAAYGWRVAAATELREMIG
jgi:hypothetical protein